MCYFTVTHLFKMFFLLLLVFFLFLEKKSLQNIDQLHTTVSVLRHWLSQEQILDTFGNMVVMPKGN